MKKLVNIVILFVLVGLNSCIIVKNDTVEEESQQIVNLSPKPLVQMSDEIVRSKDGDMIAFLPLDWFFVNVEDKASANIFSVAVNPDYTLAAVFSRMPLTPESAEIVKREGVIGLSRLFFEKHSSKTGGAAKQLGTTTKINMGPLEFGKYIYSTAGGANKCRAAVFQSSIGNYYEFALVQMDFRAKPLPTQDEVEKIFLSVISTIQY